MHIAQLVFRNEQQRPSAAATEYKGRKFNWGELADRIRSLGGALRNCQVQKNDQVAVLSLNSDMYFSSLFGIPLIGARLVPLNIRWAVPELVYSLNDSNSTVLMFDKAFLPAAEALRKENTCVRHYLYMGDADDCPEWAGHLESLIEHADPVDGFVISDDDMAGIFYTGGTTGFPKGVMLTHTALFSSALSMVAASDANTGNSMLHAAPMFHMADLAACFAFTLIGARHVIVPMFEPQSVLDALEHAEITDALLVPAMLQMLFDHPNFSDSKIQSLQRILYGASPMPEGLLRRIMAAGPHLQMCQAYGQTEVAPICTLLLPEDHVLDGERSRLLRSAGRSSYSMLIKIADENGQALPAGEIGEVCCTGPNMMLGYLNKPDETAKAIIDGWVHTGDAGYLDDEGYLFLVDRVKDMIVTGGENVYSVEVESVISTHPAVAQVAVVGIPSDEWGEAVHAIVILQADAQVDAEAIIHHCHASIAGYKCPKSVEFRSEPFPLSGAGKVLKRELRAPYWAGRDRQVN